MTVPFISSEDTPKMLSPFASRLVIWRNPGREKTTRRLMVLPHLDQDH